MPSVVTEHPDEFTLLRLVAGDTDELEAVRLRKHVRSCPECARNLAETRHLDETLKEHVHEIMGSGGGEGLAAGDPFARRPAPVHRRFEDLRLAGGAVAEIYARARGEAEPVKAALLATLQRPAIAITDSLGALDLQRLGSRLGLGYALDESVRLFSRGPNRWLHFGRESIALVDRFRPRGDAPLLEEFAYPLGDLSGRAHTVVGWALNWLGEFDRAGEHLAAAYRSFGRGSGSLHDYAMVELHESQRRSFVERPEEALVLARRAVLTFEALTLDVPAAKARFAEGLALSYLGRDAEAIPRFESALEPLAREGLWNAWVSVLNDLGTSFLEMGQYAEAKRVYAQALKRVSRTEHPGVHAFVRHNLGLIHFRRDEYPEAIAAFEDAAGLFEAQGATADGLNTTLYLIEALARAGRVARASAVLAGFEKDVARLEALDPSTIRSIGRTLAGDVPDLALLGELREAATETIRERLAAG